MRFLKLMQAAGLVAAVGVLLTAGIAYATVPTFSQTSVTVGSGQSTSISSTNNTNVYLDSNSAPSVVSVSANGTELTLKGLAPGSASLTVCNVGTASDCTNLGVIVQTGSTSASGLSFSENSFSLSIGGNQAVTVSGGNGGYSISSNSNTSVASASLSGNTITVSGLASGTTTITVCDTSNTNTCGTISVTVNASGSSGLSFGQNNLSLTVGGSQTVSISGGDGVYNISSDSNSSAVSVGMASSNSIIVDALESGSATITVCDTSATNICGTLSATVSGSATTTTTSTGSQTVTFSNSSPTLTVGQSLNITLSGSATSYFLLSNANNSIVQANVNGTVLSLYGVSAGTDTLAISAPGEGYTDLSVTVTGTGTATAPASTPSTSTVTPTATPTATATVTVPTTVVANTGLLSEIQALQAAVTAALTQLESIQSQLNQIETQVSAGSGGTSVSASTSSGTTYDFTELLTLGSEDAQVTALQNRLAALGFYSGPVTGYFGTLTQSAVMKYQTANGIEATGSLGPLTRAALNAGE